VQKALQGQDIVYHFISETFPHTSWDNVQLEVEKNLVPTMSFLETAVVCGIKKVVYISSGGTVYGSKKGRLNEETYTAPFSPYGIFKLCIENLLRYQLIKNKLNYDVYRISNVYGPYQNVNKGLGFINTCLSNIKNNTETTIYGDGSNVRDYVYSEDVANLLKLSLIKDFADSDLYHISSNEGLSINELVAIVQNKYKYSKIRFEEARQSDNKYVVLDNTKILKWFPDYKFKNIEKGIENTYFFITNNKSF
jgi:UDP-glucose 4-epimerase